MRWDHERYRQEVLEPARQHGNVPPADLYVRYGLPRDISDQAAFAQQVAGVLAFWHELANKRIYEHLADKLITAHAELVRTGPLTLAKFAELDNQAHQQQLARLDRLAADEAGAATHVGLATVTRLMSALGGSVTEAEVTAALTRAGVQVVEEFPVLPAKPHPKHAALVQHVQALGRQLSAEAVFGDDVQAGFRVLGGFRLADGRQLGEAAIAAENSRADALPHSDPAKTHTKNVLAVLSGAARAGDLDALLLSEIVERLRGLADQGFFQRAIATQGRELGLADDEAGLIAAALLSRDTAATLRQLVTAELEAGRLRNAQRLATGLPAGDSLRDQVAALGAQVAALVRGADEELAQGHTEQAAKLLAEATGIASDDTGLSGRLAALPPPPPGPVTARVVEQGHLVVSWQPSPALAGRLRYRVTRGLDQAPRSPTEGTVVVPQTEQQEVTDPEATLGARLRYSVFAGRGGGTWSAPAMAEPVLFTPEVTAVSVAVTETSVTASWLAHPRADRVLVVRAVGHPPRSLGDGTAVDASRAGFTDTEVHTGTEYYYRIVVSYRTPAGRRQSAGVVRRAVPEPEPRPVTDLTAAILDGSAGRDGRPPMVEARWTPPRYGQVRLVLSDGPPAWPVGTGLAREDAARLRQVGGAAQRGTDGRDTLRLRLPYGHHHLLALTTAGDTVIAGSSTAIRLAEPVRRLTAARMHDAVRLGWEWPDREATDAAVRWPDGEHHCSRRVYEDEGGVTVTVGPAATRLEVCPVYALPAGRYTGPAAYVQIPGRRVRVEYRIRRGSWLRLREWIIELTAERETQLPGLVVVRATGRYPPARPDRGEVVARAAPQPIAPERPLIITVRVRRGPAWLACFVDPGTQDPDSYHVVLSPPPGDEMRIR